MGARFFFMGNDRHSIMGMIDAAVTVTHDSPKQLHAADGRPPERMTMVQADTDSAVDNVRPFPGAGAEQPRPKTRSKDRTGAARQAKYRSKNKGDRYAKAAKDAPPPVAAVTPLEEQSVTLSSVDINTPPTRVTAPEGNAATLPQWPAEHQQDRPTDVAGGPGAGDRIGWLLYLRDDLDLRGRVLAGDRHGYGARAREAPGCHLDRPERFGAMVGPKGCPDGAGPGTDGAERDRGVRLPGQGAHWASGRRRDRYRRPHSGNPGADFRAGGPRDGTRPSHRPDRQRRKEIDGESPHQY